MISHAQRETETVHGGNKVDIAQNVQRRLEQEGAHLVRAHLERSMSVKRKNESSLVDCDGLYRHLFFFFW